MIKVRMSIKYVWWKWSDRGSFSGRLLCVVSGQWNVYWQKTFVQRTI